MRSGCRPCVGGPGSLEPGLGTEVLDDPRGSFSGVLDPEFHNPGWTRPAQVSSLVPLAVGIWHGQ